jgi:hypothetical protein
LGLRSCCSVGSITLQVLIGLGLGCTNNESLKERYNDKETRSVVWVSPVEDADLYVDYENDGIVDDTYRENYLDSHVIHDLTDKDMSGAFIFATRKDSGPTSTQVSLPRRGARTPASPGVVTRVLWISVHWFNVFKQTHPRVYFDH